MPSVLVNSEQRRILPYVRACRMCPGCKCNGGPQPSWVRMNATKGDGALYRLIGLGVLGLERDAVHIQKEERKCEIKDTRRYNVKSKFKGPTSDDFVSTMTQTDAHTIVHICRMPLHISYMYCIYTLYQISCYKRTIV